jgi:hypothetical protein
VKARSRVRIRDASESHKSTPSSFGSSKQHHFVDGFRRIETRTKATSSSSRMEVKPVTSMVKRGTVTDPRP